MHETLILNLYDIGCKNNCVFCGKFIRITKSLADKIAKKELKKLNYLKENKNIKCIIISGNDPIEYYNLVEFLKKIKKVTDVNVFFQSHCIDFEDFDYLKNVLDIGIIGSIQVPIYGHNEKIHDSITQNSGSFKSVIRTLENLKKMSFNNIQLHTLILKQNEDYIFELFSFLSEFEYRIDASLPCIPSFNGRYLNRHLKNIPDLNKVSEGFKKIKKSIKNLDKIFIHDIPFCIAPLDLKNINFSNDLDRKAHGGYDHLKNSDIDTIIIDKEIIPTYRILSKDETCKNCVLDKVCFGIIKPYVELGIFKAKPFSKRYMN